MAEGGEGDEGAGGREPLAGLEEDVGSVDGLEREGEAGHGSDLRGSGGGSTRLFDWI